ncbi:MAG: aspartate kinase [Dehalococcoidaceae bacterium]|nr:aspartate kinase [Dehalococcoidaceae bacterium]
MKIEVVKFGGSSVADANKIKHVSNIIKEKVQNNTKLVVVVSAMGGSTDKLIALAHEFSTEPNPRELDVLLSTGEIVTSTLLSMQLNTVSIPSISLTGIQAGIRTDDAYGRARISEINTGRITKELESKDVVVIAGFQGFSDEQDVTTLGRGGSDTTAVALAVALKANNCQIYTDVSGVFTADPRLCGKARPLNQIGYEEMLEMATTGAKVIHSRAVEVAAINQMPLIVKNTFEEMQKGTIIQSESNMENINKVRGIAHQNQVGKITIKGVPDKPGIASSVFQPLANANIPVDTIVQNSSSDNLTDLTFTVASEDLSEAIKVSEKTVKTIGASSLDSTNEVGSVSIIGTGMTSSPGYAARMFDTLYSKKVNIEIISTSEIRITCVVQKDSVKTAVTALHDAFELDVE